jgi:hypothetical protein
MQQFVPEGVNLPNVMTVGAWVIVGVVVAAALAGVTWMIVRALKDNYVPWQQLPGSPQSALFFGKDHTPNVVRLHAALTTAQTFLIKYTTWNAVAVVHALQGIRIYVMPTTAWIDGQAGKVAGLDPSGPTVVVGSDFAALLHECAHQCEEVIDHAVDYAHAGWEAKGIRHAEEEYIAWLSRIP